jgi:protein-histidine pros-kinase
MTKVLDDSSESDIKKSEERFKLVVEAAPNAMIMVGSDGKIVMSNARTQTLFGYRREELLGQLIEILVPMRSRAHHQEHRDAFFSDPKARSIGAGRDFFGLSKDGREIPIEIGLTPIETPDGVFALASITDITEHKKSEDILRRSEAQLKETAEQLARGNADLLRREKVMHSLLEDLQLAKERLQANKEELRSSNAALERINHQLTEAVEAKTKFTAMISHELRTPLTSIKEGIGLVLEGLTGPVNEEQKDFLQTAKRNVDRLHRLINEVLDFSKYRCGKMEFNILENDLNERIWDAVKNQEEAARAKGLAIEMNLESEVGTLKFDSDKIIQVIVNLLNNAIKFTDQGKITVSSSRGSGTEKAVMVRVKDAGQGIPNNELPKLFQEYVQLSGAQYRKPGSTGLGLAICRQIIEGHGGKIWADSENGEGAEFVFTLPT